MSDSAGQSKRHAWIVWRERPHEMRLMASFLVVATELVCAAQTHPPEPVAV